MTESTCTDNLTYSKLKYYARVDHSTVCPSVRLSVSFFLSMFILIPPPQSNTTSQLPVILTQPISIFRPSLPSCHCPVLPLPTISSSWPRECFSRLLLVVVILLLVVVILLFVFLFLLVFFFIVIKSKLRIRIVKLTMNRNGKKQDAERETLMNTNKWQTTLS